jgi:hypothetical protein
MGEEEEEEENGKKAEKKKLIECYFCGGLSRTNINLISNPDWQVFFFAPDTNQKRQTLQAAALFIMNH